MTASCPRVTNEPVANIAARTVFKMGKYCSSGLDTTKICCRLVEEDNGMDQSRYAENNKDEMHRKVVVRPNVGGRRSGYARQLRIGAARNSLR